MVGEELVRSHSRSSMWIERPFGECFSLQRGFDITQAEQCAGDVPVVSSSGITSMHNRAKVQGPGVVIGRKGKLGNAYLINGPFWPHDTTLWVYNFHGNDPSFAAYFLKHMRLERFDAATSVPTLNRNVVHPIRISIPEPLEQKAIAEVLDTLDEAIRGAEMVREKRTKILNGLTHNLMTRGVDADGQARDEHRSPDLFEEKSLGRFPESWAVKALGDLGETITGSTPPSSVPGVWGDGLPFITPSEVTELGETLPAQRFVSAKGLGFVSRIPPGSLLTVCIGSTLGKMALVQHECVTNQQINATIPGLGIDGTFLEHAIRLQMKRLLALAGLQAVPIVNRTQFEGLTVAMAPPEEQRKIGDLIRTEQSLIQEESVTIEKLRTIKSGLSSDLLTGRVRVLETR